MGEILSIAESVLPIVGCKLTTSQSRFCVSRSSLYPVCSSHSNICPRLLPSFPLDKRTQCKNTPKIFFLPSVCWAPTLFCAGIKNLFRCRAYSVGFEFIAFNMRLRSCVFIVCVIHCILCYCRNNRFRINKRNTEIQTRTRARINVEHAQKNEIRTGAIWYLLNLDSPGTWQN